MIKRKPFAYIRLLGCSALAGLLCAHALRADETVRQVQEELRKRHLYFGDVDGRATPEVAAALRTYQERKGLAASGQPDEITLRSLALTPPPPVAAAGAVAPLPDITVLRSDEGRVASHESAPEDPSADVEPTPASLPTPAPPPASATMQRPDSEAVRSFLQQYLQAGQTNDPAAEMRFYGDKVDYFDDGVVDHQFIAQDVRRYEHRWPERQFSLTGPVVITNAPDHDPAETKVHFRYQFAVKGSRYSARGLTDNEYTLLGRSPAELRIVSMKEQRVRP